LRSGVAIARLTGPVLTDSPEIEILRRVLAELIACGNDQLVLDFAEVTRISRQLLAVVVRTHRAFASVGGRLKLCGLRPELTRFIVYSRLEHVLEIMPDKEAALVGKWSSEPPPRNDRVASWDELAFNWLATGHSCRHPPKAMGDGEESCSSGEAAFNDCTLTSRVFLGVLVLEPWPPRLEGERAVGPLLRALVDVRERPGLRRLVIDLSQVVTVSLRTVAVLAIMASDLARAGGEIRLSHVRPRVVQAVNQSRLVHLAKIYPTVDEAVLDPWG
jgi:anti-anti-sigma regulatory factor